MANQYLYDLTDTWNNVATTFDAIKINVTDTNSAAGSKLLNLQVGASPKFTVQKDGAVALTGAVTGATSITGSGTFTADRLTITKTTANAPAISSTGYSLTGSDATSLVDLAGTWNTTGNPTAIKLNVTNTASGTSAYLMDLQVGGTSIATIRKSGSRTTPIYTGGDKTSGMSIWDGSRLTFTTNSTDFASLGFGAMNFAINQGIGFSAGASTDPWDLFVGRDASNTLAQRNAGNAQTFNIYNTYSSSTSYERLSIIAQSAAAVQIVTNKGSAGGSARALELGTDGTTRLTISTGGNVTLNASGAGILIPANGYFSFTSNGLVTAPSDGVWRLTNNAQNDWGRLQFGGTTSSFPALKRSSATLICRLADDSANAAFESASVRTDAPTGGTAATWKLGTVASVSPTSPDRTIEVDIGGTIYYIHAKTTNN